MTPRQSAFVREYLIDLNATQAAIRAGYSAKTANEQAARLLANVSVAAAVQAGMDKRANKLEITAERVLAEISFLAFYDVAQFVADNAQTIEGPQDIKNLPEDVRRAIVGWSWDKAGNFTLKLADKLGALEKLGRHLRLFTDKVEVTGKDGGPVQHIDPSKLSERDLEAMERVAKLMHGDAGD